MAAGLRTPFGPWVAKTTRGSEAQRGGGSCLELGLLSVAWVDAAAAHIRGHVGDSSRVLDDLVQGAVAAQLHHYRQGDALHARHSENVSFQIKLIRI